MGADRVGRGRGTVEYEIALDPQEEYSHAWLAPALRMIWPVACENRFPPTSVPG